MRIVFFGTPIFVVPVLKALEDNFQVVGIVTAPDSLGRNKKLIPSPIKNAYQSYIHNPTNQTAVLMPIKLDENFIEEVKKLEPDLFVTAAYGKILPKKLLEIPKFGSLNVHPSLLPRYRGPSPIQSTILNGDRETGVVIMQMDEQMDHGPILYAKQVKLGGKETLEDLSNKLFQLAADHTPDTINGFVEKKIKAIEQNHAEATSCKEITKHDGFIDPDNPPSKEKIERMIRAFHPWPGAWTKFNSKILKLYPHGIVQLEGKNLVSIETFQSGYPDSKELLTKLGLVKE